MTREDPTQPNTGPDELGHRYSMATIVHPIEFSTTIRVTWDGRQTTYAVLCTCDLGDSEPLGTLLGAVDAVETHLGLHVEDVRRRAAQDRMARHRANPGRPQVAEHPFEYFNRLRRSLG